MKSTYRYKAFLSYSHADKRWAKWIHTRLETFRTPKALVGGEGRWGATPSRLQPIFRDRDELTASAELGPEIQQALDNSEFLVVLSSPAAAQSRWVNEEIRYFRSRHPANHVLTIIIDGDPSASVAPGEPGCFPPALLEPEPGSQTASEPIAADARKQGDGKRLALLKVEAGLLGVGLNDLVQRDAARRQRRLTIIAAASLCGTAVMMVLAIYANIQRVEATHQRGIAETETAATNAALDYLVSLFEIANPATENPKTITALTVLERGRNKIDAELSGNPRVQGKLLSTIGEVYMNLGLYDEAEDTLSKAISIEGAAPNDQVAAQLELAFSHRSRNQLQAANAVLDDAQTRLEQQDPIKGEAPEKLDALKGRLYEIRGAVAYSANDYENAESFWHTGRDFYQKAPGEHAEELGRLHTNLGLLLANRAEFEAATKELETAIQIHSTRFGENHLKTASSRHTLAFNLYSAGEIDAAAEQITAALLIYELVLESNHPALGDGYMLAGRVAHAAGELEASARFYEQANAVFSAAFGDTHHQIGWVQVYLALVLADSGSFDQAFAALDRAGANYAINYPGDDIYTGDLLVHRSIVLGKSGQTDEAVALCAQGLELIRGKMSEADAYVQEMAEACEKVRGEENTSHD